MRDKTEKYKGRVRDFLVQMATKPMVLGQYIPPVKHIMRNNDETKNIANAQLYINGFKTNKERLEVYLASFSEPSAIIRFWTTLPPHFRPSTTSIGPATSKKKYSQACDFKAVVPQKVST